LGARGPAAGPPEGFARGTFFEDGVVIVDGSGRVAAAGPGAEIWLPVDLPVVEATWIGPGIVDAHVHLAGAAQSPAAQSPAAQSPAALLEEGLRGGVVAVRDLGGPVEPLAGWHGAGLPVVAGSGPCLALCVTDAVGGGGFAGVRRGGAAPRLRPPSIAVDGPASARRAVARLVVGGADVIAVVVIVAATHVPGTRPGSATGFGRGTAGSRALHAVVAAAHAADLPVTASARSVAAVKAVLAAGVDELAHVPVEHLPAAVIDAIAAAGIAVVSTLQSTITAGGGSARNAAALHEAGVPLMYGTDSGAPGTLTGVDHRELDRLAFAGLGRAGALLAATSGAARASGLAGRAPAGDLAAGQPAAIVALPADPLVEPAAWRGPAAVVAGSRVLRPRGGQ
jgi:imidazolonepropionase-like amidohydrolase